MEEIQNNKSEEESIIPILDNENIKNNKGIIKIPLTYNNLCTKMFPSVLALNVGLSYLMKQGVDDLSATFTCIWFITSCIIIIIIFCCCVKYGLNFIFDYDNLKLEIIHHNFCGCDFGGKKKNISFNRIKKFKGNVITNENCDRKTEKYSINIKLIDSTIINVAEWEIGKGCCSDSFDISGYVEELNYWLEKGQDQVVE